MRVRGPSGRTVTVSRMKLERDRDAKRREEYTGNELNGVNHMLIIGRVEETRSFVVRAETVVEKPAQVFIDGSRRRGAGVQELEEASK